MSEHYILDGRKAVPADLFMWATWFERGDRRVAKTVVGSAEVSTVFLGLDHAMPGGPPQIFETLVFGGPMDGEMERYSTWDQAESGHVRMVDRAGGC